MLKILFFLTLRSFWLTIVSWIQLFHAIVCFHTSMCWKFISWTISVTTLPIRALGALRREKMMEELLLESQYELESLSCDNEKLKARLQMALKENNLLKSMLAETEEEHDMAIGKIELLEQEVKRLKDDNLRLREDHTKGLRDPVRNSDEGEEHITGPLGGYSAFGGPDKSSNSGLIITHKNSLANERKDSTETNPTGLVDPLTPLVFSSNVDADTALGQRREVALSQCLFSAFLSLLVGVIIWEAKEPCMPLVMALFAVVGLSLKSVVLFFSTIKNKPASDAVTLLSFNWFILGTLTYPTLPIIARMLSPVVFAFLEPVLIRLGLNA